MPVDITRDEVQRLAREGAQVVDVRPPAEFEDEHVAALQEELGEQNAVALAA